MTVRTYRGPALALRRLVHLCEYVGLRLLLALVCALPRPAMLWLGSRLGDILRLLRIRRGILDRNLDLVGYWSGEERRRLVPRLYRAMGRYAADLLRTPVSQPPLSPESEAAVRQLGRSPHGTVVLFAHFGNWELLMPTLAATLGTVSFVVKPMNNPLVNRWLTAQRRRCGLELVPRDNAYRAALRVLRAGGTVAIALDQWPGDLGTPCRFLGVTTKTVRTIAGLALMTHCRVLAAHAVMQPDGTYRVVMQDLPLPAELPADDTAAVALLQAEQSAVVSAWIREQPEHWFGWLHRRFKDIVRY